MTFFPKFFRSAKNIAGAIYGRKPIGELTVGRVVLAGGAVGLGAMGLGWIGGLTSAHGGRGFPEDGMGPIQRKLMTDFGSGYQGDSGPGIGAYAVSAIGVAGGVGASALMFPFQSTRDLQKYPQLAKMRAATKKSGLMIVSPFDYPGAINTPRPMLEKSAGLWKQLQSDIKHYSGKTYNWFNWEHMKSAKPTELEKIRFFKGAVYGFRPGNLQHAQALDQLASQRTNIFNTGNWGVGGDKAVTWKHLQAQGAASLHAETLLGEEAITTTDLSGRDFFKQTTKQRPGNWVVQQSSSGIMSDLQYPEKMTKENLDIFRQNPDKYIFRRKGAGRYNKAGQKFIAEAGGLSNIVVKTKSGALGTGVWLNASKLPKNIAQDLMDNPSKYLFQKKLDLVEEYRVVTVGGKPIHTTYRFGSPTIRKIVGKFGQVPSKDLVGAVKVKAAERSVHLGEVIQPVVPGKIRTGLEVFATKVSGKLPYSIGALDIGRTKDGKFTLIEAQRGFGNLRNPIVTRRLRQAITGKHSKLEWGIVSAAAIIGGILGWGAFSGKDDEYNTIEGLPERGMAGTGRRILTDFGSGYQGTQISKLVIAQLGRLRQAWRSTTSKGLRAAIEREAKLIRELEVKAGKTRVPSDITAIETELSQIWKNPLLGAKEQGLERWKVKNLFKRAERIGKKPLEKQKFGVFKQGEEVFMPSGTGLTEAVKTTNPVHFSKTLRVMRKVFQETTTPFTKSELSGIQYMLQRSTPETFAGIFGIEKAAVKGFRQHAANLMTRNVNLKSGAVEGVKFNEVVNALIFRSASKERIGAALTGVTKTSRNINTLAAIQEEFILRSKTTKPLWTMFGQNRQINPKDTWSWFSGSDDAWNVIEGFQEKGISSELRKIITDFGSGWDPIRAIARQLEVPISKLLGSKEFKKSLLSGQLVKQLSRGGAGSTSVELMEGVFGGQAFRYVRKNVPHVASPVSMTDEIMQATAQGMAQKEIRIGTRLHQLSIPTPHDIAPNIYGYTTTKDKAIKSIFQEYIEGSSLEQVLKTTTGVQKVSSQEISRKMSRYLSYMKKQGISHGDTHPGNIIMTPKSPTGFSTIDWGFGRIGTSISDNMTQISRLNKTISQTAGGISPTSMSKAVSVGVKQAAEASRTMVEGGFAPGAPELKHIASTMPKAIANAMDKNVPSVYMKQNIPLSTKVRITGSANRVSDPGGMAGMVSSNIPRSKVNISVKDNRSKLTPQAISDMIDR